MSNISAFERLGLREEDITQLLIENLSITKRLFGPQPDDATTSMKPLRIPMLPSKVKSVEPFEGGKGSLGYERVTVCEIRYGLDFFAHIKE